MTSIALDVVLGIFCAYVIISILLFFFPAILHKKKRVNCSGKTIAHRGGSAECLENTMSAFRNAVEAGADVLEIDCQITKDRKVVICHDNNLQRLTGLPILVSETCYQDLPLLRNPMSYTFPRVFTVSHHDRQIPLLEDLFQEFPQAVINLDVKEPDVNLRIQVESLIRKYNRETLTIWGSWSDNICKQLFNLNPNIPLLMSMKKIIIHAFILWVGLLPFIPIKESYYEPPVCSAMFSSQPITLKTKIIYRFVDLMVGNRVLLYHYRRRGLVSWCWIVNDELHFERCLRKFDGVMTDRISALVQFVRQSEQVKDQGDNESTANEKTKCFKSVAGFSKDSKCIFKRSSSLRGTGDPNNNRDNFTDISN